MPWTALKQRFEQQNLYPEVLSLNGFFEVPEIDFVMGGGTAGFFPFGGRPLGTPRLESLHLIRGIVNIAQNEDKQLIFLNTVIQEAIYDFITGTLAIAPEHINNQAELEVAAQRFIGHGDGPFLIMNFKAWNRQPAFFERVRIEVAELSHVGREVVHGGGIEIPAFTFLRDDVEKNLLILLGRNDSIVMSDLTLNTRADGRIDLSFRLGCPDLNKVKVYSL